MNWTENTTMEEEIESKSLHSRTGAQRDMLIEEEQADKQTVQLRKFQNPENDAVRQTHVSLMNKFGELLVHGNLEEISKNLLVSNCETFLFSATGRTLVQHVDTSEGFLELFRERKVIERRVRETNFDVEKGVGLQICNSTIYDKDDSISEEVTFEIFNFQENKITKYRAASSHLTEAHGPDPFQLTKKDKIMEKIKKIQYAWADQPDLEKVASLLHENAEYKVWSWDAQKCFVFTKQNLPEKFQQLEENLRIKCVVPYEVFTNIVDKAWIGVGTYAYHLEAKADPNEKYVWLNTCAYSIDDNINILKVSQLGELHKEQDIEIPFEVYPREKIVQRVHDFFQNIGCQYDLWYNDVVHFACEILKFGPAGFPFIGLFKGLNHIDKLMALAPADNPLPIKKEWAKGIDIFVDMHDPRYDCTFYVGCMQVVFNCQSYKYSGLPINMLIFSKMSLENGKLARVVVMKTEVVEPIPSPFDDLEFSAVNITKRNKS